MNVSADGIVDFLSIQQLVNDKYHPTAKTIFNRSDLLLDIMTEYPDFIRLNIVVDNTTKNFNSGEICLIYTYERPALAENG